LDSRNTLRYQEVTGWYVPGMRRKNKGKLSASGFLDFRKTWQVRRRLRRKRFRAAITLSADKPAHPPTPARH
jgi:hypothetical protein